MQDAAGIATVHGTGLRVHKGKWPGARRVRRGRWRCWKAASASPLPLPDRGGEGGDEAQPFYVNSPFGIALAHNGNLVNTDALRRGVRTGTRRNVNTGPAPRSLLNVFRLDTRGADAAAFRAHRRRGASPKGGYAVVCAVLGLGAGRVPRPERDPPAGAGQEARPAATSTSWPPIGRWRWTSRLRARARRAPGRGASSSPTARRAVRQCAPTAGQRAPASSSTCTSRARTR